MPRQAQDLFKSTPVSATASFAERIRQVHCHLNGERRPSATKVLSYLVKVEGMCDSVNAAEFAGLPMLPALVRHKLLQIRR